MQFKRNIFMGACLKLSFKSRGLGYGKLTEVMCSSDTAITGSNHQNPAGTIKALKKGGQI